MDNVLDYLDESFYMDFRAQGHGPQIQFVWIYDHDVDLAALRRFHQNLGTGLLSRCVERSPLPFGRSRWVKWTPPADFDIAERARPRSELAAWVDEQSSVPIQIESGPPWRLAVQPLTEGGAAVTLIVGHGVADTVGMLLAVADAVNGVTTDLGYPPPHSRTKAQALREDTRQLFRDLPDVAKALVKSPKAAKAVPLHLRAGLGSALVRRRRIDRSLARSGVNPQELVRLPSVTTFIDGRQWDERAKALGGSSNTLLIGVTSRLCQTLGWRDEDGLTHLVLPVNERRPGDTRGNALTGVLLTIDPAEARDLTAVRAEFKAGLGNLEQTRDSVLAPLPLTPFMPKFLADRMQDVVMRSAAITCSGAMEVDPAVCRIDGTDAEWFYARHSRNERMSSRAFLKRVGGLLFPVGAGRAGGKLSISVCYDDADGRATPDDLKRMVQSVLGEFGISPINTV